MGMAAGAPGQAGGRRRRRRAGRAGFADINMTPFIDVMLVLLIVFMVAAPLLTAGVPVDLPQSAAKPLNLDHKPVTLSINEQGRVFLGEQPLPDGDIVARLQQAAKAGMDERIYLRGAKKVDYGRVAQVMGLITAAGFKRVALVTEPDQS
ncbi:ExbD/TolR family protein [Chelatococcus reniformis]|uniref:Protein TolR n=1 Tax=Chelatococcus reniformis TaxID=1494448 RepID=A0A916UAF1_9HYPH|nr:biopolymer transporter ExbD [Chelatococcus reniformis]GGC64520.1 protein TolR [Chelatococcus reniformis]